MDVGKVNPAILTLQKWQQQDETIAPLRVPSRVPASRVYRALARVSVRGAADARDDAARALLVVRCDPERSLADDVEQLGGVVHEDEGSIRTISLPFQRVPELTDLDKIRRVRLSRPLTPRLDNVARLNDLDAYRRRFGSGRTGKDVLIGVIDTGIDGRHAAFGGRIVECWDQTARTGTPPRGLRYGRLVTAARSMDRDGHGTHVAGIAAGRDGVYCGVAPEARLLIVKTDFEDAHIQDAVRYVFRRAKELGMPAVVNLSLGGHGDPHDGTDDLDALIDQQSGAGRIVVAAAGNEGEDSIHTQEGLEANQMEGLGFRVPRGLDHAVINLWYEGHGEVEVSVSTPFGAATAFQGTGRADPTVAYHLASAATATVSTPDAHPVNGDKQIYIDLAARGRNATLQSGRWFVHLRCVRGPVTVHGWMVEEGGEHPVTWTRPVDSHLIGSPGAAREAITVAAFVSRVKWKSEDGSEWSLRYPIDRPAPFSSPGPLRNGGEKPDFAAAGAMVCSARSSRAVYDRDMPIGPEYVAMMGTSMACPVIAGIVATLLEANPDWTPTDVRSALRSAAGPRHSPKSGWGLVLGGRLP